MYAAETMERNQIRKVNRAKVRKQQRERKRLFLMILLTLLVIFSIGFGFGTLFTKAQEPEQNRGHKYYTSIQIEKGDTLWDIAGAYMDPAWYHSRTDYVNEVMSINQLTSSRIVSGRSLIIPYYADTAL